MAQHVHAPNSTIYQANNANFVLVQSLDANNVRIKIHAQYVVTIICSILYLMIIINAIVLQDGY